MIRRPPRSTLFPLHDALPISQVAGIVARGVGAAHRETYIVRAGHRSGPPTRAVDGPERPAPQATAGDRKSTRLNSSHANISYAVFCLKKKNQFTLMQHSNCTK